MKVERIIFMQGDEANEYLNLLERKGKKAVVKQLMEYWQPGEHDEAKQLSAGNLDDQEFIKVNGIKFVLTYNLNLNYIGLEHVIPPKYYIIQASSSSDLIYSHITTEKPKDGFYDEYDSFFKAKKALIHDLWNVFDGYRNALKEARALRKADFEESENAD